MSLSRALFTSTSPSWATPDALYRQLDAEFHFDHDPCKLNDATIWDGKTASWRGKRVYCNPPYGPGIGEWLAKAREADLAVYLLPARTDTAWWHDLALKADEIRFVRGRLKCGGSKNSAPFPSVILVYWQTCLQCKHAGHGKRRCEVIVDVYEMCSCGAAA